MVHTTPQRDMPRRRAGLTTSVTIGGERFYLTANGREDGTLGEVFISWGKQGHTKAGLMDIYAVALSVGLQHGVPLLDLIQQGLDLFFVPNGHTDDPDFPRVRSVVDWVARRLAVDWLPYQPRAQAGILTLDERVLAAGDWLATQTAKIPPAEDQFSPAEAPAQTSPAMVAFRAELASGIGNSITPRSTSDRAREQRARTSQTRIPPASCATPVAVDTFFGKPLSCTD